MADPLGGAVGAVMGEMVKYALQTIKKGRDFGPTLETNIQTLNALAPLVEEMKGFNDLLDRPREEIKKLETHIREVSAYKPSNHCQTQIHRGEVPRNILSLAIIDWMWCRWYHGEWRVMENRPLPGYVIP
ncbi:hypothetical protein TSUD_232730 [Trifolium subterraneum]|uniref:RPW8 domain-containing protein n=1 Tax=Trifolium subterraneum TaxID=3900 RepID=A0A2Z6LN84_TRISU|nr:hypothetical protein TSUD_232730 [Trifolium subterraneum]